MQDELCKAFGLYNDPNHASNDAAHGDATKSRD